MVAQPAGQEYEHSKIGSAIPINRAYCILQMKMVLVFNFKTNSCSKSISEVFVQEGQTLLHLSFICGFVRKEKTELKIC